MALPSPDDVEYIVNQPIVQLYWPLLIGALLIAILMVKGRIKLCLIVAAAASLLQGIYMGGFS